MLCCFSDHQTRLAIQLEKEAESHDQVLPIYDDERRKREILRAMLLPQTPYFFYHDGKRLHVRHWLPPAGATISGTIFFMHGLNGHQNGVERGTFQNEFAKAGFAVAGFDCDGHGYSEGLRSYVEDFEDIFNEMLHFVGLVMGSVNDEDKDLGLSHEILAQLRSKPYFIMGESMGGMLSMLSTVRLYQKDVCAKRPNGIVLIAPALKVDIPSAIVVTLLQTVVVPLFRTSLMPEAVSKASNPHPELCWKDPEKAAKEELDNWHRFPGLGLCWKDRMRWATASAFATCFQGIENEMAAVECPILVLHDPGDQITSFSGSEKLMELSPSQDKTLIKAKGALHDVCGNELEWSLKQILPWLHNHL